MKKGLKALNKLIIYPVDLILENKGVNSYKQEIYEVLEQTGNFHVADVVIVNKTTLTVINEELNFNLTITKPELPLILRVLSSYIAGDISVEAVKEILNVFKVLTIMDL